MPYYYIKIQIYFYYVLLIFNIKGKYKGVWKNGILQSGDYLFKDGLHYKEPAKWDYCTYKDRRFYFEIVNDIKNPDVSNFSTLFKEIPENCYDTGDGYYDPEKGMIFSYDQKFLRYPNEDEEEWIKLKCRYNPTKIDPSNYNNEMLGNNDDVIANVLREYKFKSYKLNQNNYLQGINFPKVSNKLIN